MVQSRAKLIGLFIGNISNAAVHNILEKAIEDENLRGHYNNELKVSFDRAKRYREKINPTNSPLPDKDTTKIRRKIVNKVKAELLIRISKGYKNINLGLVENVVDKLLKEAKII